MTSYFTKSVASETRLQWLLHDGLHLRHPLQPPPCLRPLPQPLFSPCTLRPFSNTGPGKTTGTTRSRRQSDIYSDTHVKQAVKEENKRNSKINLKKGESKQKHQRDSQPEGGQRVIRIQTPQKVDALCTWAFWKFQTQRKMYHVLIASSGPMKIAPLSDLHTSATTLTLKLMRDTSVGANRHI